MTLRIREYMSLNKVLGLSLTYFENTCETSNIMFVMYHNVPLHNRLC